MTELTKIILAIVAATVATPRGDRAPAPTTTSASIVTLGFSAENAMGGETVTGTIRQVGPVSPQNQVFRLSANAPSLKFNGEPEVVLPANQSSATFTFTLVPSTIKTAVTVSAVSANGIGASGTVQIFPALIKTVRLSAPSMVGTHGAVVSAAVELNAAAPPGGVELYPFMTFTTGANTQKIEIGLEGPAPRVAAGSRTLAVPIAYDALRAGGVSISRNTGDAQSGQASTMDRVFNSQTSRIELVMSVEPQTATTAASPTAGISSRHTIDVVPLRITASSAQPSSVVGGAEAVATFTSSAPPGPNEVVLLSPATNSLPVWARPTGVACSAVVQTADGRALAMTLTPGATSQSFKICTSATTNPNQQLTVLMRSGQFTVPINVRP